MSSGSPGKWRLPGSFLPTLILIVAMGAGNPLAAVAAEGLRLSGFGTLGYSADNRSDIAAARDISQLPKNRYSTSATALIDSRLGLQIEYSPSPNVDLVGQVVWRDHFQADLNSSTELAYLAFRPDDAAELRVGRIGYDSFLMSDHRNVGYAYTWVRPPTEFYGWIPIYSVNGIDGSYNVPTESGRWRIKAQAGSSSFAIPVANGDAGGYEFRTNNLRGLSAIWQTQSWRVKAAYSQFTIGPEVGAFAPLHQGLDQVAAAGIPSVSAEAADLRRNLSFGGARITYATLGASYDDRVWLGQAELGHTTASAAVVPHGNMAYVMAGRRLGAWLAFVGLGTSRPGNGLRGAANNWGTFNSVLRDPAVRTLNSTRIEQDTASVGARWDVGLHSAVKLQWDSSRIRPSGYGLWWRNRAINEQTVRVNQLSATLDFVF